MGIIKQLPTQVANQISAGEVVERPASIVKELIENSIDADSSNILIEIEDGGRKKIRIKDNGKGIAEDDMELAFERYATSKIENANDLYSIKTLGFRGEALSSIASVSKLKISSCTKSALKGTTMKLIGGEIQDKKPIGMPAGTEIIVKDIFFNTPARYKYLKTINTEFGHISNIVTKEALAFPDIKFTLIHNGKKLLETAGTGKLIDSIFAAYSQEIVDSLIPIEYEESYVKLSGYIAKPDLYRSSRIHELFFVNNRSVYNRSLARGVESGYYGLIPPAKYPIVFIKLKLNQILVDVNIHPSKREIKFSRDEIIENVIKKGIRKTLENTNTTVEFNFKKKRKEKNDKNNKEYKAQSLDFKNNTPNNETSDKKNQENYSNSDEIKINSDIDHRNKENNHSNNKKKIIDHTKSSNNYNNKSNYKDKNYNNNNIDTFMENNDFKDKVYKKNKFDDSRNKKALPDYNKAKEIKHYRKDKTKENTKHNQNLSSYDNKQERYNQFNIKKIFGQLKKTYILVEMDDGLYIIDQHNAHERILHDRFIDSFNKKKILSQSLLIPINLEVTLEEREIINKYKDELAEIGIKIEEFGSNSFIVSELPTILKNISGKQAVNDIIDNLFKQGKTLNTTEIIENTIAYMSCRSAVKAGAYLDFEEIENIVLNIFKTSNPNRCPHGRPIIVKFSINEINRSMGR
ncbi:MAG: DNA mismatch repair endonuclease MutL [bacterium]